jgi:hypothetical protein
LSEAKAALARLSRTTASPNALASQHSRKIAQFLLTSSH